MLLGAFVLSPIVAVAVRPASVTIVALGLIWGLLALVCGFRPLLDAEFRAEGSRLAHTLWFFRTTYGWKGLAATILPISALTAVVTSGSDQRLWGLGASALSAAAAVVLVWRVQRSDVRALLVGVAAAPIVCALAYLWLFVFVLAAYIGWIVLLVYLVAAGISWLWLRRHSGNSACEAEAEHADSA